MSSPPTFRGARYSESLERGLAVLGCFTPDRLALGIADIAEKLAMGRSTTHRYVLTLVALGYLEQHASHKYRLGLRVIDLGMAALNSTGLRGHARPCLEELCHTSAHTTSLAVLDGAAILYVDRARSFRRGEHEGDLGLRPGPRLPAHATALGKLLLAYLPARDRRALIGRVRLSKHSPTTITSRQALCEELGRIREEGLAVSDEELAAGLRAIAAPVRDESGEVIAALDVAADRSATTLAELVALRPQLIATAERISARLGYRGGEG